MFVCATYLALGKRFQGTEDRSQRTEDRGQKSEDRKQDEQLRVKDEKPERTERETRNAQPATGI